MRIWNSYKAQKNNFTIFNNKIVDILIVVVSGILSKGKLHQFHDMCK